MGYYSTVNCYLHFNNKNDAEEFMEGLTDVGGNPLYENCNIDSHLGSYFLTIDEHVLKMNDYGIWIPVIARLPILGILEIDGEEDFDFWKIEFLGKGLFKIYRGEIVYQEITLRKFCGE